MGEKRNRRSDEEMLEHYKKQLERVQARIDGTADTSTESGLLRSLKAARRKRATALHNAQVVINGKAATAKSPATSTIDEKIANLQKRLADYEQTKANAITFLAQLPDDIERLTLLIEKVAAGDGDDVEFPRDLTKLPGEDEKTDTEHEISVLTEGDVETLEM